MIGTIDSEVFFIHKSLTILKQYSILFCLGKLPKKIVDINSTMCYTSA